MNLRWLGFTLVILLTTAVLPSQMAQAAAPLVYQAPAPASRVASPQTGIILRAAEPVDAASLHNAIMTLTGSHSGQQRARLHLALDGRTVLGTPEHAFVPGELVQVQLTAGLRTASGQPIASAQWQFGVARPGQAPEPELSESSLDTAPAASPAPASGGAQPRPAYVTVPGSIPEWTINGTGADLPDAPYIFLAQRYWRSVSSTMLYNLILDRHGELVYYRPIDTTGSMTLQVTQPGEIAYYSLQERRFHLFNEQYQETAIYTAGNGYVTDSHEIIRLANGNIALMIYNYTTVDMTQYGGPADALVNDTVLQELDGAHNVVFEWHSLDHVPVTDSYRVLDTPVVDYLHGNAIEEDSDGNWLFSARHTSTIYKINRTTGAIMWYLGGKQNQFTFDPPTITFNAQHDIRRLENGHITLFDNWNTTVYSETGAHSRGLEFAIDEQLKTATLVRAQANTPNTATEAMGSAQVLSNNGMALGWGSAQDAIYTEFDAGGIKQLELDFPNPIVSYRAKRFAWNGAPTWPPVLVAQAAGNSANLFTSWNGDTSTAAYAFSTGPTPDNLSLQFTVQRTGFETQATLPALNSQTCFAQSTALDAEDTPLAQSVPTSVGNRECFNSHIFMPLLPQTSTP